MLLIIPIFSLDGFNILISRVIEPFIQMRKYFFRTILLLHDTTPKRIEKKYIFVIESIRTVSQL